MFGRGVQFFFLEPDQTHPQQQSLTLNLFYSSVCCSGAWEKSGWGRVRCAQGHDKNKHTYILIGKKISQCCVRIP